MHLYGGGVKRGSQRKGNRSGKVDQQIRSTSIGGDETRIWTIREKIRKGRSTNSINKFEQEIRTRNLNKKFDLEIWTRNSNKADQSLHKFVRMCTTSIEFRPIANEFVQKLIEICSRFWSKTGPGTPWGTPGRPRSAQGRPGASPARPRRAPRAEIWPNFEQSWTKFGSNFDQIWGSRFWSKVDRYLY